MVDAFSHFNLCETGLVGTCSPLPSGTACPDDGSACTADKCNGSSLACQHPAGNVGAVCRPAASVCDVAESCNGSSASCPADAKAPDGTACSDGSACTTVDRCSAGTCAGGAPPPVDDGNPCTADACNPATGVVHTPLPAGASCDDTSICNGVETCDGAGACLAGHPPFIDDDNPCTLDTCLEGTGGVHTPVAAGTSCTDDNACNGAETCDAFGLCAPGFPPLLNDFNACTIDACEPASGVTHTPDPGASCAPTMACPAGFSLTTNPDVSAGEAQFRALGTVIGNELDWSTLFPADSHQRGVLPPARTGNSVSLYGYHDFPHRVDGKVNIQNWLDGLGFDGSEGAIADLGFTGPETFEVTFGRPMHAIGFPVSSGLGNLPAEVDLEGAHFLVIIWGPNLQQLGNAEFTLPPGQSRTWATIQSHAEFVSITIEDLSRNITDQYFGTFLSADCNGETACTSHQVCTASATCGVVAGPVIDDGNACTADTCDPVAGVAHTSQPAGYPCSHFNLCQTFSCDGADACVADLPVVCSAIDACHDVGTCNPTSGNCSTPAKNEGASCVLGPDQWGLCRSGSCDSFLSQFPMSVEAGSIDTADPQLVISPFDNPLCQGTDTLQTVRFNATDFPERVDATTSPAPWIFHNFNLVLGSSGDDAKGARTVSSAPSEFLLIGEPTERRIFNSGENMPYLVHGVEIGHAESTIQPIHQEISALPRTPPAMRIRLEPQTILVPVQVIRVLPPASSPIHPRIAGITVASLNEMFDDKPRIDVIKVSHPGGEVFANVNYQRKTNQLKFARPDSVWAQCGVQFRAVSCLGFPDDPGRAQCPDLVVTPFNVNTAKGICNISAERRVVPNRDDCDCVETIAKHNMDDALDLPGVRLRGLPVVLLTWSVSDQVCGVAGSIADIARVDALELAFESNGQSGTSFALAHELGHLLGLLGHVTTPTNNVMAPFLEQQSSFVPQEVCQTVRTHAAALAHRMWGVDIDPGQWTITPPPNR